MKSSTTSNTVNALLVKLTATISAISKRRFVKQVGLLFSGTLLAQGLIAVSSPIVTRLYLPEALGVVAVFTSLINLISSLASAAYPQAVPLPKTDREAVRVLQLTWLLLTVSGVMIVLLLVMLTFLAPNGAWSGVLGSYVWLLPLGVLLYGGYRAFVYWPTRKQAFGLAAQSKLAQAVVLVVTQVLFGWLAFGAGGLIAGVLLSSLSGLSLLISMRGNDSPVRFWQLSGREMMETATRYKRFPVYAAVPGFLESLSLDLPVLLLAWMFGPQVAGWVALSQRVLAVPATFIAASVKQAFVGEAATRLRTASASIQGLLTKMVALMVVIGVPCVALLVLVGPPLFGALFGSKWVESGVYVRLLAPMYLMQIVAAPTGSTLDVLERQDLYIIRVVLRFALMFGGMMVTWTLHMPASDIVAVLGLAGCLTYAIYLGISFLATRDHQRSIDVIGVKHPSAETADF